LVNQRDQFNAKNQLAINQSNAVWRREIATMDTAAANFANQTNAQNLLNISNQAYNNLWQEYRDVMNFAWQSGESEENRLQQLQLTQLQLKNKTELTELVSERERAKGIGGFLSSILTPFAETGITVLGTALLTGAKTILKGA
jgi:DNA polymerase III delta prime subunit